MVAHVRLVLRLATAPERLVRCSCRRPFKGAHRGGPRSRQWLTRRRERFRRVLVDVHEPGPGPGLVAGVDHRGRVDALHASDTSSTTTEVGRAFIRSRRPRGERRRRRWNVSLGSTSFWAAQTASPPQPHSPAVEAPCEQPRRADHRGACRLPQDAEAVSSCSLSSHSLRAECGSMECEATSDGMLSAVRGRGSSSRREMSLSLR